MRNVNRLLKLGQALYGHTNTLMYRIMENENFSFTIPVIIISLFMADA